MAIKMEEMVKYDLYKLLKEELGNGSNNLVTRPSGQAIRERIERDVEKEPEGAVIGLDFSKIGVIDYSCADEIIAKLVSRLVSGEYGDKYLFLAGLNENQKENIEVAVERKDLAVVAEMKDGSRDVLGNLNSYLRVVTADREVTLRALVESKLGKLNRYLDNLTEIDVELTYEKVHTAEARNHVDASLLADGSLLLFGERGSIRVWRDGRIVALLDWERAFIGDPMADVAFTRLETLAGWCSVVHHSTE